MESNDPGSLFEMQADPAIQKRLNSSATWGRFISVTGLVIAALVLIAFAAMGKKVFEEIGSIMKLSKDLAGALIAISVVLAALYIGSFIFLLKASSQLKQGLRSRSNELVAEAFKAWKTYFTLSAVISILSIAITLYTRIAT
jgi:hypothetical protein